MAVAPAHGGQATALQSERQEELAWGPWGSWTRPYDFGVLGRGAGAGVGGLRAAGRYDTV